MADKRIGELPSAPMLYDDMLFAVENQGVAMKLSGRQIKSSGGGSGGTGGGGSALPDGGSAGQILAKRTSADQDAHWIDPPEPSGSGGGFVEMTTPISVSNREENTLYGLIIDTF